MTLVYDAFVLIVLLSVFSLLIKESKSTANNLLLLLAFYVIVFFRTFVEPTSLPDLTFYMSEYNYNSTLSLDRMSKYVFDQRQEFGYLSLSMVCSHIYNHFSFFLLVIGLIISSCTFSCVKKYSPYMWISLIIYVLGFYRSSWFQIRQFLAVAITMAAYPFVIKKKVIFYFTVLIVAFTIHRSCLVFFPVYFFYNIKNNILLIFSLFIFSSFIGSLIAFIPTIIDLFGMQYIQYLDNEEKMTNMTPFYISLAYLMSYVIVLKSKIFEYGINRLVFVIFSVSLIMTGLCVGVPLLFRLILFYSISTILLVPLTMAHIQNKISRWLYAGAVICMNYYITFHGSKAKLVEQDAYISEIDVVVFGCFVILGILAFYSVIGFPTLKKRLMKKGPIKNSLY